MNAKFTVRAIQQGQTQKTHTVTAGAGQNGQALMLQGAANTRYQLADMLTFTSPAKLQLKRVGKDLLVALPGNDVSTPDIVIRDYFEFDGMSLSGLAQNGEPMVYDTSYGFFSIMPGVSAQSLTPNQTSAASLAKGSAGWFDSGWGLVALGAGGLALAAAGGGGSSTNASLSKITTYKADATKAVPSVTDFAAAGVSGVDASNITAVLSYFPRTQLPLDSAASVQSLVDSFKKVAVEANGTSADDLSTLNTTAKLTALALACLLLAAQVQAQPSAPAGGQGYRAIQGSSARPNQNELPVYAPKDLKAHAQARALAAKRAAKAKRKARSDHNNSPALQRPARKSDAANAPVLSLASAGKGAAVSAPSNLMPLPKVVGPLPEGNLDSRVRGNDGRRVENDSRQDGNDAKTGGAQNLPVQALSPQGGLSLQYVLDTALRAHPSLQASRLDVRASAEDQKAIERQRWPTLSAIVENRSTNTSVVSTRVLRLEQNLWDAGRLSARIREAESNVTLNEVRVYMTSQQLSLQIINAWQNLMASDSRIAVAQQTIAKLYVYRQQMLRRVQSEASPPIDLELVVSRLLQTEVEQTQARNNRAVALRRLELYSGLEGLSAASLSPVSMPDLVQTAPLANWLSGVDWTEVASRHPNVQKARQDVIAAQYRIDAKKAEQFPQVYLRLEQPINAANNDITGFVGLRYTPGAGLSTAVEAQALSHRVASLEQEVDSAMHDVTENLFTDRDEFNSARSRMQALEKAVKGSEAVLESYSRQFNASRKTWLDLMNAVRELAQNQYALADSQSAMNAALYRLQVRMGEAVQPAP